MVMLSRAPLYLLHRRGVCWQLRYRCVGTMLGMPTKLARLLASIRRSLRHGASCRQVIFNHGLLQYMYPYVSVRRWQRQSRSKGVQGFVRRDFVYHASSDTVGAQFYRIVSVRAGRRSSGIIRILWQHTLLLRRVRTLLLHMH